MPAFDARNMPPTFSLLKETTVLLYLCEHELERGFLGGDGSANVLLAFLE